MRSRRRIGSDCNDGRARVLLSRGLRAFLLLSLAFAFGPVDSAFAQDAVHGITLAFDLQTALQPGYRTEFVSGQYQPVSQDVLATQRGSGSAFALPLLPAAQSQPGVVLWDEMKQPQNQSISAPGGQATNQINILVR